MRKKIKMMTDEEREAYLQGLSEQERLQLLILDEIARLHVRVSSVERKVLKVLATLKDTSVVQEGTEAVYEELEIPTFQVGYRTVASVAAETYGLDQVAAFLYLGEPEKPGSGKKKRRKAAAHTRKGVGAEKAGGGQQKRR